MILKGDSLLSFSPKVLRLKVPSLTKIILKDEKKVILIKKLSVSSKENGIIFLN